MKNVYVGCGEDVREGFIHSDVRALEHVSIVCKAWELSEHIQEIDHIYSRHMLEHLTNYEADRALRDWFKALKTDGTIRVIVPDMDFHCRQWLSATWDEENIKEPMSDAKHSFAGFWGWQRECDPWSDSYNTTYWDVHKSGYNAQRITLLLKRIGYTDITTEIKNNWHLVVEARKPKYTGERQVGTTLESIRLDHRKRYLFAAQQITKPNTIVIDAACGVGYGSFILAQNENIANIYALDISQEALTHAQEHFNHPKIEHTLVNLETQILQVPLADYFISFETIEHLRDADALFAKIAGQLKAGGIFIGSTPNEEIMPFNKQTFMYHTRHFSVEDLQKLLQKHAFNDVEFYQQKRIEPSNIQNTSDGQYIIFKAKKDL